MAKKKSITNPETSFIEPIIRNNGEKHLLEEMFEAGEEIELKAVGYAHIGKGPNSWVSYVVTVKGDRVVNLKVDELNPKALAEESAKLSFVTDLMDPAST